MYNINIKYFYWYRIILGSKCYLLGSLRGRSHREISEYKGVRCLTSEWDVTVTSEWDVTVTKSLPALLYEESWSLVPHTQWKKPEDWDKNHPVREMAQRFEPRTSTSLITVSRALHALNYTTGVEKSHGKYHSSPVENTCACLQTNKK